MRQDIYYQRSVSDALIAPWQIKKSQMLRLFSC